MVEELKRRPGRPRKVVDPMAPDPMAQKIDWTCASVEQTGGVHPEGKSPWHKFRVEVRGGDKGKCKDGEVHWGRAGNEAASRFIKLNSLVAHKYYLRTHRVLEDEKKTNDSPG